MNQIGFGLRIKQTAMNDSNNKKQKVIKPIVWTQDLSVGVRLFDEQHKKLVATVNKMIQNPTAETRSETIAEILTEMTQYALEHFKSEEDLMIKHGYPQLEEHQKEHIEFTEKVAKMCIATVEGTDNVPHLLLEFLHDWLHGHMLDVDMKYKDFFKAKGVE